MRAHCASTIVAILLASRALFAQQTPATSTGQTPSPSTETAAPDISTSNYFDFGFRGTGFEDGSDEARYQRYRDLRNGITVDALRYARDTPTRWFSVEVDHAGYRDQRYSASLNQFGRLKTTFEWNQIPLFFSQNTTSLHTTESPGVLRVDDSIQTRIQNAQTTLPGVVGQAVPFDMRLKRNIASFSLTYSATPTLDLNVLVKNTDKEGSQPWAGTFGFSNAVELATPVDTRTTEFGASADWGNGRGSLRVAYDGSYFRNQIDTLVWDSPLRITDSPTAGPFQGRMSLWPDSSMNTGSVMGTVNLGHRTRATAYVSIGNWSQDAALIPFTINTALPVLPLDRPTADASAAITATNFSFTSRPFDNVSFLVRYRSYDFDNQTPVFNVTNTVWYDTSVDAFAHGGTSPLSVTRNALDAEISYTPTRFTALRAGYTREQVQQTFRSVDETTDNTARLSADFTGTGWLTLRGVYEHTKRTGFGFDEQVLDDIGEQVSLRQFDISDKSTDRVSAIVMVIPRPDLSFNAMVSGGRDDRPDDGFGVLGGDTKAYSFGADYVPRDAVSAGVSYTYERYATTQRSRQANPGAEFEDPTRDWTTDATERADTFTADLDLIKAIKRSDLKFAYTYSHAESLYVYGLPANTTLPPIQQLPAVTNQLSRATVDYRYYITRHLAGGVIYWYDKYTVSDYANEAATLNSIAQPSFLMIGYTTGPYTANTIVGRVTYIW